MDPLAQELSQTLNATRPVMAASILKTFGKVTAALFGVAWMVCMPVEMLLHRRMGKRYCNTFFVLTSFVLLGFLTAICLGIAPFARALLVGPPTLSAQPGAAMLGSPPPGLPRGMGSLSDLPGAGGAMLASPTKALQALEPHQSSARAFGALNLVALVAFIGHYIANRRRFGTQDQGHSCDFGIPWLIYPPALVAELLIPPKPRLRLLPSRGNADPLPLARVAAHPLQMIAQLREAVLHHLNCLRRGEVPHGPFNWLYIMYGQPVLLAGIGAALLALSASAAAFGVYLIVVALGMWFKGMVHQAEWRERAYDDMDNKLESEALRNWRAGSHASAIARQFTVPITTAILAKRVGNGNEPIMIGPDFDGVLSSDARDQQRGFRNAA